MKQYIVPLLFIWLILITCDRPVGTAITDSDAQFVAVTVTASIQASSTYKITISGSGMKTIGPQEYAGGQTIQLYVPEGIGRKFYFERFSAKQLTDTGTTISDIGSGMNSIHVTMTKVTTSSESCSVSYYGNGNTGGKVPDAQFQIKGGILKLDTNAGALVKSEYTFKGWNTKPDGSGKDYLPGSNYTADSSLLLYAKWVKLLIYNITYNGNGNTSGRVPAEQSKTEGITLKLAFNIDTLAKKEYYFVGWNTRSDGNGTDYAEGADFTQDTSLTLYAKWDTLPKYTVTYNGNGNSKGVVPDPQSKLFGVALTILDNTGNLEKIGYTFDGWCTSTDSTGKVYTKDSSYTGNADLFLYAKWKPITFTVIFDGNKNTRGTVPASQIKFYGDSLVLSDNTGNLEKTDFIFDGWSTSADGVGRDFPKGASYNENANVVLYAKWKPRSYTVTFDGNQNTSGEVPAPQIKEYGESLALADNTGDLQKTNFVFDGWSTSADGVGTDYPKGSSYTDNADVILYAKWKHQPNTITYDGNKNTSGSVPAPQIKEYDQPLVLPDNTGNLERTGFVFDGWSTSADGNGTDYPRGTSYRANEDVVLYVKWKPQTFTITYNGNGNESGTVPSSQIKTYGVAIAIAYNTGNLKKTGSTFDGWNTLASGDGTDYAQSATDSTEANLTLYAKWKALDTYSVQYDGNGSESGTVPVIQTTTKDVSVVIDSNSGSLTKAGYTFGGWTTNPDGTGTEYAGGQSYTAGVSTILYVKWNPL
jgi:uncharacterized repeat protein (TIGR02543 family)